MGNQTHLILHEVNQQGDACTKLKRNFEMRVCSVKAAEHSELGVQVPCATEFDASCEIHLKDMISSVLEEKTFAANVQVKATLV